jgi:hypothetical protein
MHREYLSGLDDSLEDEGKQENSCLEDINHEDVRTHASPFEAHYQQSHASSDGKEDRKPRNMEDFLAF